MAWNGDERKFNYKIKSTSKELIELFAQVVRKDFDDAVPKKRLKIETVNRERAVPYFEMKFSYGYHFHELFDRQFNEALPEEMMLVKALEPFYTIQIQMVIERSNFNQYSSNYNTDIFYVVTPVK